jgi:predicted transcriptional regulator
MNIPKIPDKNKIASEINRLMKEKKVSVQDLSVAMNRPRTTIYNIKQGWASYDMLSKAIDTLDNWESK